MGGLCLDSDAKCNGITYANTTLDTDVRVQYVIVTGTNTIVPGTTDTGNHCDDCDTNIGLPFSFTLYEQTFDSVNVNSNGRLDFMTVNEPNYGFRPDCLPAPPNIGPYDYTIFGLWHDLHRHWSKRLLDVGQWMRHIHIGVGHSAQPHL